MAALALLALLIVLFADPLGRRGGAPRGAREEPEKPTRREETARVVETATAPSDPPRPSAAKPTATPAPPPSEALKIVDMKVGVGPKVVAGDEIQVHYEGKLEDGTKFDASYDRGAPTTFTIGKGQLIKGWEEGIPGMRVGGKRRLTIPPSLGYGARGVPPKIPPSSTLVFEIELVGIK